MKRLFSKLSVSLILFILFFSFFPVSSQAQGKLFIMGGGSLPPAMINTMLSMSGLLQNGYGVVLSMEEMNDSACSVALKQFPLRKIKMECLAFTAKEIANPDKLDSLRQARLIYISGRDQKKLSKLIRNTRVAEAIRSAYKSGAVVAGNSAGASILGKWMITGDELKHTGYTGEFRSIEARNIEVIEGLGLVDNFIFDPHFIKQLRMNRLISVVIEHGELTGVGIDEGTALVIDGNSASVIGNSQVVLLRNPRRMMRESNGLLSSQYMDFSIFVSGDKIEF